ncbi:MAG TPA: prolipoprotein diacylglyceryl transferase family protein [Acidobacteriota bacterium]|nr:prolipoprotein diacylglyceryl transferase family protein [Acidobacteriota bacterium]
MQFPVTFHIGAFALPAHFIFDVVSYYFAFWLYVRLRKNSDHITLENRQWILVGAAGGALFGAVLFGALEHISLFLNPPSVLYYFSNKTIVGGLIGGLIGVELVKKCIDEKKSSGDLFVFPLIFAIAIGRIGCFLTGVSDKTAGLPSSLPWAIDQGDGILRHPTALYEIMFLVVLGIILFAFHNSFNKNSVKKRHKSGVLFKIFLASYCAFRLLIDFIKPVEIIALGLSAIQLACALLLIYYIVEYMTTRTS